MTSVYYKHFKSICLIILDDTFHGTTVIGLFAKHNVICQFIWGLVNYDISHGMPVEAGGFSASLLGNMVTPLGLLCSLCDIRL